MVLGNLIILVVTVFCNNVKNFYLFNNFVAVLFCAVVAAISGNLVKRRIFVFYYNPLTVLCKVFGVIVTIFFNNVVNISCHNLASGNNPVTVSNNLPKKILYIVTS